MPAFAPRAASLSVATPILHPRAKWAEYRAYRANEGIAYARGSFSIDRGSLRGATLSDRVNPGADGILAALEKLHRSCPWPGQFETPITKK